MAGYVGRYAGRIALFRCTILYIHFWQAALGEGAGCNCLRTYNFSAPDTGYLRPRRVFPEELRAGRYGAHLARLSAVRNYVIRNMWPHSPISRKAYSLTGGPPGNGSPQSCVFGKSDRSAIICAIASQDEPDSSLPLDNRRRRYTHAVAHGSSSESLAFSLHLSCEMT